MVAALEHSTSSFLLATPYPSDRDCCCCRSGRLSRSPAARWTTRCSCPGCVDLSRDNRRCEWIGDTTFVLDPTNRAHQRHLVRDAHLAEGLAVRFADAEHGRRFGIEHHGGLIDNGGVWRGCMSRMTSAISTTHAVTVAQIQVARTQRSRGFDVTVALLFLPLYGLASVATCRALLVASQRTVGAFASWQPVLLPSPRPYWVAICLVLWSMPWEAIRVGNGHIGGFRLATYNRYTLGVPLLVGVLVFWLTALCHRRVPQHLVLGAATVSSTILAAMFARTFVTTPVGYLLPLVALLGAMLVLGLAASVSAGPDDT